MISRDKLHPGAAVLMDRGVITKPNALMLAKLPKDRQPKFFTTAARFGTYQFRQIIKGIMQ